MDNDRIYLTRSIRHEAAEQIAAERGIDTLQALRRMNSFKAAQEKNRARPTLTKAFF